MEPSLDEKEAIVSPRDGVRKIVRKARQKSSDLHLEKGIAATKLVMGGQRKGSQCTNTLIRTVQGVGTLSRSKNKSETRANVDKLHGETMRNESKRGNEKTARSG